MPSGPVGLPTLQFLDRVAVAPRPPAQARQARRTSCPRLPVWEGAVDQGPVRLAPGASGRRVVPTSAGSGTLRGSRRAA